MMRVSMSTLRLKASEVWIQIGGDSRFRHALSVLLKASKSISRRLHFGAGRIQVVGRSTVVMIGKWSALGGWRDGLVSQEMM